MICTRYVRVRTSFGLLPSARCPDAGIVASRSPVSRDLHLGTLDIPRSDSKKKQRKVKVENTPIRGHTSTYTCAKPDPQSIAPG